MITRTAAALLLGLFAGGVLFVVLAPTLRDLSAPAYVRYWQALNADHGKAMPVLLLTAVALLVVTCVLSFPRGTLSFGLSLAATVLIVGAIALTVTQMEPLNTLADSWNPDAVPADWSEVRDRWWTLHLIRTALAVTAFASLLIAQLADPIGHGSQSRLAIEASALRSPGPEAIRVEPSVQGG
jgi:uncharacterized membrane protein